MPDKSGAHCPQNGMNHRSIAICIVGNFDNSPVRDESWGKALKLCRHLCRMNNIPFENVTGHYEHNPSKTCPGKNWDMKKFRNDLAKGD
jgi:N-acetyl-anhydromuramyl-L-alanine amidase AmpD